MLNDIPTIVVMGVSGCGKSTIGLAIAATLGRVFIDADDLHPTENKLKMAQGVALDDADREPWLDAVAAAIAAGATSGQPAVVACSALKRVYRDRLRGGAADTSFVHLHGTRDLLASRMSHRVHEYMPTTLLDSQLETLEPLGDDESGFVVDISSTPGEITEQALLTLGARV